MEKTDAKQKATIDPVCGMDVVPGKTRLVTLYQGHSYWFCASDCREAFEANPQKYLGLKHPKRKGWFSRYLDRMANANQKHLGCGKPKCH
ncbi:MAG: YHS domain-containing protein [Deltaproteobacteria bacterium]|nr:YHS domain-containing protein [Deltaproteobacteria bacterium]